MQTVLSLVLMMCYLITGCTKVEFLYASSIFGIGGGLAYIGSKLDDLVKNM